MNRSSAAVVFDVDDTLVTFSAVTPVALAAWLNDLGAPAHLRGAGFERMEQTWRAIESHHFAAYTRGLIDFDEQRRRRAREFCAAVGLPAPVSRAAADAWFAGFLRRFEAGLQLFPDVVPVLDTLRRCGIPTAVMSNSSASYQDRKLRRLGVRNRFCALVCCEDAGGVGKPDPRIFHAACTAVGRPVSEVWYVGDRLDGDARAAASAGLHGVWLDRAGAGTAALDVPVLRTLRELPALLAAHCVPVSEIID